MACVGSGGDKTVRFGERRRKNPLRISRQLLALSHQPLLRRCSPVLPLFPSRTHPRQKILAILATLAVGRLESPASSFQSRHSRAKHRTAPCLPLSAYPGLFSSLPLRRATPTGNGSRLRTPGARGAQSCKPRGICVPRLRTSKGWRTCATPTAHPSITSPITARPSTLRTKL